MIYTTLLPTSSTFYRIFHKESLDREVVIKVEVDGWHIPLLFRQLQLLIQFSLVHNSILLQRLVHVKYLAVTLPGVAGSVEIYGKVTSKDLLDRLLAWHLQDILSRSKSVHNFYLSAALRQLTNIIFLIFPPWNAKLVCGLAWFWEVQVSSLRTEIIFLSCS